MIYVFIGIFMLLVFGLCFLVDKLYYRLTQRRLASLAGMVRLPRRSVVFGIVIDAVAIAALLFLAPKQGWIWRALGGALLVIGTYMIFNYCTTRIDYDDEGFTYRQGFRKKQRLLFRDIRGETAFAARSGINATLFVGEEEVNVYSSMEGVQEFLRVAFQSWCRSRGIDPDTANPPNPGNLIWFNEPVDE